LAVSVLSDLISRVTDVVLEEVREVAEPTGSDAGAIIAAARAGSTGGGQGEEVASRNSSRFALSAIAGCASAMIMAIVKSNPAMLHLPFPPTKPMMAGSPFNGHDQPVWERLPSGRVGLLEMFNWSLYAFSQRIDLLRQEIVVAFQRATQDEHARLSDADRERLTSNLQGVEQECAQLGLGNADNRLGRIFTDLRLETPTYAALMRELRTLHEAIEDDIRTEYFFHYRRDRALLFPRIPADWLPTLRQFKSSTKEIEKGIDCYGLEHYAACVFHMMRVAEIGMRALARERQVSFPRHPLEWAEWENVIDQIDKKARDAANGIQRGPARDAVRTFYTTAVAQLRAFKETRNRIMHMRGEFDELDAERAINQVRDFMNGLSAKIDEETRRPIRRWP
jgi:hypothetical protein